MIGVNLKISCLMLLAFIFAAGCGTAQVRQALHPDWEPASTDLSPIPEIQLPMDENPPSLPPPPFSASDFAMELAKLSSQAAAEVSALKADADIKSAFPDEAAAMLEEAADSLKAAAAEGYESLELEIIRAYSSYINAVGKLEDQIKLGESMEYVLGRDVVGYYQLNSTKINEMKKAYWSEKLDRLKGELSSERCRFRLAKQAKLLARAAEVGANQRAVINQLEGELETLALDYAAKVKTAIDEAMGTIVLMVPPPDVPGFDLTSKIEDFERDFENRFEKVKLITGP